MADEAFTVRSIDWRELFPFTNLFRAFRVAIHPSKLIIALVALAALWIGGLVLDGLWPKSYMATPAERAALFGTSNYDGVFHTFFHYEVMQANNVLMFRGGLFNSFDSVWDFIAIGPLWLWKNHWFF